jgi:hypothetical protein
MTDINFFLCVYFNIKMPVKFLSIHSFRTNLSLRVQRAEELKKTEEMRKNERDIFLDPHKKYFFFRFLHCSSAK